MINDAAVEQDLAEQWSAIKLLCRGSHRQHAVGGVFINETPPDDYYNLPFVLAYAVLDQALSELIAQGTFRCARWELGAKMGASRNQQLPWVDFALVEQGKGIRNALAHKAKVASRGDCFKYIDAIEAQLKAWQILRGPP